MYVKQCGSLSNIAEYGGKDSHWDLHLSWQLDKFLWMQRAIDLYTKLESFTENSLWHRHAVNEKQDIQST